MLTERQKVKVKVKIRSPILIRFCTFQSFIFSCQRCSTGACVLVGAEFSVPFVFIMQQEEKPIWPTSGSPCNLGFTVGD